MSYSSCYVSSNVCLGCASNVGGLKTIYLVAGEITGVTYDASSAITGITGTGDIYEFALQKQSSSLTETINSSLENGTTFYQQDAVLVFHKMEQSKRNQVKLLAFNRGLKAFAVDNNDTIWYLGGDFDGGFLSAGTGQTGTAFGDANSYNITLSFYSKEPATTLGDTLANVVTGLNINEC